MDLPAELKAIAKACLGLLTILPFFPECNLPALNSLYTLLIFFSLEDFFMTDLIEIWKPVPDYEGIYEVSNYGKFAVIKKDGRYLRKLNTNTPYLSVSAKAINNGKPRTFYIHQLVAKVFIGNRPNDMVVRHLDGNRYNNKVNNLAYGTPEQNYADNVKHKTHKGSNNGRSIFNESSVKAVKYLIEYGIKKQLLADAFGVSVGTIYAINSGRNWSD
jgi:hypothetical protein